VDVRIGIVQSMKEIEIEMPDSAIREELMKQFEEIAGADRILWLTDRKDRRYGIPGNRINYIEFGQPASERRVGFATS